MAPDRPDPDRPGTDGATLLDRVSLRSRLVVLLLALLTVALVLTGFAATTFMRGYLSDQVDREMLAASDQLTRGGRGVGGPMHLGPLRPGPRRLQALPSRFQVDVLSPDGTSVLSLRDVFGGPTSPALPAVTVDVARQRAGRPYTVDASDGTPWRVLLTPLGSGRTLVVSTPVADVERAITRLRRTTFVVDALVLAVLAAVGLWAVHGALRPLRGIERTAEAIARGDLSRRVPDHGARTEVGRLSRALNGMLTQIERAFRARSESETRMRRFVADASHELRTPLTSIRGFAELYQQGAVRDPGEVGRLMRRIEAESVRMAGLVDDLLLLARLDEQRPLRREPVDLAVLAADAVADAAATGTSHVVALDRAATNGRGVVVQGDEERLRQVVANLVTNALRHTPDGTRVTVSADLRDGEGVLEVADDGPGLTDEQASHVFDRFYRADPSRTRESGGGSGLGLAIVAALVQAHGGRVELETAPGRGATFRVRVPSAPAGG